MAGRAKGAELLVILVFLEGVSFVIDSFVCVRRAGALSLFAVRRLGSSAGVRRRYAMCAWMYAQGWLIASLSPRELGPRR